jgi:hypothetical protein
VHKEAGRTLMTDRNGNLRTPDVSTRIKRNDPWYPAVQHEYRSRATRTRGFRGGRKLAVDRVAVRLGAGRAGYPGSGGGSWLRMIFPAGLVTWPPARS